jgi:hypothetical protein
VTQHGSVMTSVGGEMTPEREKGCDDASWANASLTGLKNEENPCDRFSWYK